MTKEDLVVVILQSTYRVPILHEDLPYAQSHLTPGLCGVCSHPVPDHLQFETQANGFRFCQIPLSRSLVGKKFLGTASARASGIAPHLFLQSTIGQLDLSIVERPLHHILTQPKHDPASVLIDNRHYVLS